jgi:hypothetical protein
MLNLVARDGMGMRKTHVLCSFCRCLTVVVINKLQHHGILVTALAAL